MPFTVNDFQDLLRLLEAHPDWRSELRRAVLSDELLAVPDRVTALAEHMDRGFAALTQQMAALTERVAALTERVTALTAAQERSELRLDTLTGGQIQLHKHVAALRGADLERRFADRAPSYLGPHGYRRTRVVVNADLADLLDDAADAGLLTEDERADILRTDTVIRARDQEGEIWVAAEVSATVDEGDITRARRRAKLLGRIHGRTTAAVAGYALTEEGRRELASDPSILVLTLPEN